MRVKIGRRKNFVKMKNSKKFVKIKKNKYLAFAMFEIRHTL